MKFSFVITIVAVAVVVILLVVHSGDLASPKAFVLVGYFRFLEEPLQRLHHGIRGCFDSETRASGLAR